MQSSSLTNSPASSSPRQQQKHHEEVKLAIYDLSGGVARNLSAQFLGPQHTIDIVPHTGIVVFGKEYYFGPGGPGISAESPELFRSSHGLYPIQIESLGYTSVSQTEFESWCIQEMSSAGSGRFRASSYDLLERNCNTFSHHAAIEGLRLDRGVPDWILQVPQQFLASPMGQMLRPMLQGMQMSGGHGLADSVPSGSEATAADDGPAGINNNNPWASMNGTAAAAAEQEEGEVAITEKQQSKKQKTVTISTPVLDSYSRPFLSNDTSSAKLCLTKLSRVNPKENEALRDYLEHVQDPTRDQVDRASTVILKILKEETNITTTGPKTIFYALLLLRLLVLFDDKTKKTSPPPLVDCLEWLLTEVTNPKSNNNHWTRVTTNRSMIWCVLSNAYGKKELVGDMDALEQHEESLCCGALADIMVSTPSIELRQAAAAFLFNCVLRHRSSLLKTKESLSDNMVSLLCGCLDSIEDEADETTRLRRILIAGRIVKPGGALVEENETKITVRHDAITLLSELGLASQQRLLSQTSQTSISSETTKSSGATNVGIPPWKQAANELIEVLEHFGGLPVET